MGERGAWLGAVAALVLIGGASMLPKTTPDAPEAPAEVNQSGKPVCPIDIGGIQIAGKVDPGLNLKEGAVTVPIYRSYVPARVHLLACPSTDACRLPEELPVHLYTGVGPEPLHKHAAEPQILSRGRCMEFEWSAKAEEFWPHAPEGVVRWAVVVDSDGKPKRPRDWRREGRPYWVGEVVYAGKDGSPTVY